MSGNKLIRQEEVGMVEEQRRGLALMIAGKTLLWLDVIPLIYVFSGLSGGSRMWLWWLLAEGAAGLLLVMIGYRQRGSLTRIPR
jgi:hypothetical protein